MKKGVVPSVAETTTFVNTTIIQSKIPAFANPANAPTTKSILDPQTGLLPLGDMAISLERARDQAKRFGNSLRRETGYLTIHSILHLLGYDHMDEGEMKRQMRTREEIIAGQLGLQR